MTRAWDLYFLADADDKRAVELERLIWAPLKVGGHPVRRARIYLINRDCIPGHSDAQLDEDEVASGIDHALNTYDVQRMKASQPASRRMLDDLVRELRAKRREPGKTVLVKVEAL